MKCAVFPCLGLGDGLIALILSHNLSQAGHEVDTFHPFLGEMQPLFPKLALKSRPSDPIGLEGYDKLFFIYEKLDWMQRMIAYANEKCPEKVVILNPIATPHTDYPYWEVGRFDGRRPFIENLVVYCQEQLGIEKATKDNGLILPPSVVKHQFPRRVILHPTSSRPGKNWTQGQFLKLAEKLKKDQFEPVFILTEKEKKEWPEGIEAHCFKDLNELTCYLAESGWMIGNDSGIGHLASLVGVPTLTISRSQMAADFWRPAWSGGRVIVPPHWIPNLKGLRLRDKKWQFFVPVAKVYSEFSKLCILRD